MKHILKFNLAALIMTAFVMIGCNTNDTTEPTTPVAPNAPTALMAKSDNANAVGLKWTAPTGTVTPTGYLITVREKGAATALTIPIANVTTYSVSGLGEGKVYQFSVQAVNDTAKSTATSVVEWAPARRGTATYKLYSSANSTNGSGLAIFGLTSPSVLKISQGELWDICFDDKTAGDPRIGSPGQSKYVDGSYQFPNGKDAKVVYISDKQYGTVNSLDDIYETDAFAIPASNGEKMLQLNTVSGTSGFGFVIGTKNSDNSVNYAKVLVKRTGGNFVQGSGADSYIECEISYQTIKDLPYALRVAFENYNSAVHTPQGKK